MAKERSLNQEKYIGFIGLLICLLVLLFYYQYPQMWQLPPQGSHLWRQTDCMAMAWNYKLFHLPFFQPAAFNLQSVQGNVAGEFPLFYYMAARSSQPEWTLRFMHSLVYAGGLASVYFIAFHFLRSAFLSVSVAILFFTSPLLVFYGNNFLSDVPAWSFAMMGWAVFLNTGKKEKLIFKSIAFLFFAIAVLFKASQAFNFVIAFFFQFSIINSPFSIKKLIPYSLLLIPLGWYVYAKTYNAEYHNTYYFLGIYPIWKLSLQSIALCFWRMTVSWSDNYFWRPTGILFVFMILLYFIKNKNERSELNKLTGFSFLFTWIYVLLFLERMMKHEYYYVLFFVFAVFAVIAAAQILIPVAEKKYVRLLITFFLLINSYYCKNFVHAKLADQNYNGLLASNDFQKFLTEKGCTQNKVVISLPDASVSQSLYWVKRKGYSAYNDYPAVLQKKQADFLIVSSDETLQDKSVQPYLADSVGNFHGVRLYKLK